MLTNALTKHKGFRDTITELLDWVAELGDEFCMSRQWNNK